MYSKRTSGSVVVALALAFGALTTSPAAAQKWLLVRSEADALGSFSWKRLGQAYLRQGYRIVRAKDADSVPAASRLVVGTPGDNPLVKSLAGKFGIEYAGKRTTYQGRQYPDDAGLAIVTADPDGSGTLVLFTGATPEAVFNCLSVPVDLARHGFVAMSWQEALHRGKVKSANPLRIDGSALRVIRLDLDLWRMRDQLAGSSPDEAALRVSRAFAGYKILFQRAMGPDLDLFAFTRRQFAEQGAVLAATRKRFAKLDLHKMLGGLEQKVAKALGGRQGPRPVVYTIVTQAGGTNAQVTGRDEKTGRIRVTLNLAAFKSVDSLEAAAAHEFVHTMQKGHDGTLLARALHEGVAEFVSQQLLPGTKDHEVLMWSEEKLAAANKNRKAIFAAFRRMKGVRDMRRIGDFLYAGKPLKKVAGAPDRCGYWIGLLAVKAWRAKYPKRPLADVLTLDPKEAFAALEGS